MEKIRHAFSVTTRGGEIFLEQPDNSGESPCIVINPLQVTLLTQLLESAVAELAGAEGN